MQLWIEKGDFWGGMRIVMVILKVRYRDMLKTNLEKDVCGDFDGDGFCFFVWKRLSKGFSRRMLMGICMRMGIGFWICLCRVVKSSSLELGKSSSCQKSSRPK